MWGGMTYTLVKSINKKEVQYKKVGGKNDQWNRSQLDVCACGHCDA